MQKDMKIIINEEFLNNLEEFYKEKDLTKFSDLSICFKSGKTMRAFWASYNNLIKSSDLEICKKISEQYNTEFLKKAREKNEDRYNIILNLFLNETNLGKFNHDNVIAFPDETKMGVFWEKNKDKILESNDLLSTKIKRQYAHYCFLLKRKKQECEVKRRLEQNEIVIQNMISKLKEFRDLDYAKFEKDGNLKFKNGMSVFRFWNKNYDLISSSYNIVCTEIMNQYEEYVIITENIKEENKELTEEEIYNFVKKRG